MLFHLAGDPIGVIVDFTGLALDALHALLLELVERLVVLGLVGVVLVAERLEVRLLIKRLVFGGIETAEGMRWIWRGASCARRQAMSAGL